MHYDYAQTIRRVAHYAPSSLLAEHSPTLQYTPPPRDPILQSVGTGTRLIVRSLGRIQPTYGAIAPFISGIAHVTTRVHQRIDVDKFRCVSHLHRSASLPRSPPTRQASITPSSAIHFHQLTASNCRVAKTTTHLLTSIDGRHCLLYTTQESIEKLRQTFSQALYTAPYELTHKGRCMKGD
jgi:hypothetical protein